MVLLHTVVTYSAFIFITENHINYTFILFIRTVVNCAGVGLPTRTIGFGLVWEKLLGLERSSRLQLCLGELRQVGHH